ncbi:MAG: ABC transporter substrate-binding protein [Victivallaceae bacterium]
MNKNIYLNIIMTLILLILVFFGILLINRQDSIYFQLRDLQKQISQLDAGAHRVERFSSSAPEVEKKSANPDNQVANLEYFNPLAPFGGRMIRTINSDTQNMNALINNDSTASTFNSLCNSSLAERNYGRPLEFQPLLAEKYVVENDNKTYHIFLRKGLLWHDFTDPVSGREWKNVEVKAADFKFYIDVINNPKTNCAALRSYYADIESVEVINDYEFKVNWRSRLFKSQELTLGMTPLPRHLYHAYEGEFDPVKFNNDHQRNRLLVGCGPYRFVKWEKDRRVSFTAFENYFGKKLGIRPPIKDVVFDVYKISNSEFQDLLAGNIDVSTLLPEQWVRRCNLPEFGKNGILRKLQLPGNSYSYIGYNLKRPLFQDRRVRQALTLLTNRERIVKEIYFGLAQSINGPIAYTSPYYDQGIKPYPFDPAAAKQLLSEAGWRDSDGDGILDKNGVKFEYTIMQVANHPIQEKMLPMIKEDLAKAGIIMNIKIFEWSAFLQRIDSRDYDACTLGWTVHWNPTPISCGIPVRSPIPGVITFRSATHGWTKL